MYIGKRHISRRKSLPAPDQQKQTRNKESYAGVQGFWERVGDAVHEIDNFFLKNIIVVLRRKYRFIPLEQIYKAT